LRVLRRTFVFSALASATTTLTRGSAVSPAPFSPRAIDIVQESNVIDMLGLLTLDWRLMVRWQTAPDQFSEADFRKLRESGIDVFHPAVAFSSARAHDVACECFANWNRFIAEHPQWFVRVDDPLSIARAKEEGKIGIILGMQDADHLRSVDDVDAFYAVGQRLTQLTYNSTNRLGSGCLAHDRGLTAFGGDVVARMNSVGMAIDVSHCGERTSRDAIEASQKPVLITHSNCRAIAPSIARCKSDEVIKAAAAKGGVIGLTSVRHFVRATDPVTIEHMLDHFDHAVQVAGVEHVGIGSDMDLNGRDRGNGPALYDIAGLNKVQRIYELTEGLIRRGYTDAQIRLILGENFQRALGEIWNTPISISKA
jgi:membrane dipeptidase